jgi:hypothetical protein
MVSGLGSVTRGIQIAENVSILSPAAISRTIGTAPLQRPPLPERLGRTEVSHRGSQRSTAEYCQSALLVAALRPAGAQWVVIVC